MTKVILEDTNLKRIADAIRSKNGETDEYTPYDMADKISELETTDINEYFKTSGFSAPSSSNYLWSQVLLNLPSLDISNLTNLNYAFTNYPGTSIPLLKVNANLTSISQMFYGCKNITEISEFDTSKVTNFSSAFQGCSKLKSISLNTDSATNLAALASGCTALENVTLTDTSRSTAMDHMFYGCNKLKEISDIDATSVTNSAGLKNIFYRCWFLSKIVLTNTDNVKTTENTFYQCQSLVDLTLGDIGNSTSTKQMFFECSKLVNLPQLNTANVTDHGYMFYKCSSLVNGPEMDTSNSTNIEYLYCLCNKLESMPMYDCGKVIEIYYIVNGAKNTMPTLTTLGGFKDLGKAYTKKTTNNSDYYLTLGGCPNLTHESLMNVINNLYDLNLSYNVANGGTLYTQRVSFAEEAVAKLTEEEIAIASGKGWTIVVI